MSVPFSVKGYAVACGSVSLTMPRIARTVIEGLPYHITQRGNRGQEVFFSDGDRRRYLSWLRDYSDRFGLDVLAYCLMTTHIHLVAVPKSSDSISTTLHALHTRYSNVINTEHGWSGHLWQGRFFSTALDEAHLWAAVRYVERNPIRAGLVKRAEEYPWSSAAFHLGRRPDKLIRAEGQWGAAISDWDRALNEPEPEADVQMLRDRTQRGFPCGDEAFVARLAEAAGRDLVLRPRGRPRK